MRSNPMVLLAFQSSDGLVPDAFGPQPVGELAGGVGGVPLLGQDGGEAAGRDGGLHHLGEHVARQLLVPVDELGLLALVHAAAIVRGQPLAPAVQGEVLGGRLPRRKIGVADEHQVGRETPGGPVRAPVPSCARRGRRPWSTGRVPRRRARRTRASRASSGEGRPWRLPGSGSGYSRAAAGPPPSGYNDGSIPCSP